MNPMRWKDPGRKRIIDIKYNDENYVPGYDIDVNDFADLVCKLKKKIHLSSIEDKRYGEYIMAIIETVIESPKFKSNDRNVKFELRDQMAYELCTGILSFNPDKKSSIFSYAYRIAYVAGCHYFTNRTNDKAKQKAITEHCLEEMQEYIESITNHKINNINKD